MKIPLNYVNKSEKNGRILVLIPASIQVFNSAIFKYASCVL